MTKLKSLEEKVWNVLTEVKDPEIPAVSVIDLGMIYSLKCHENSVHVQVLPTFIGCPALDIIRKNIENALYSVEGIHEVLVEYIYNPPWTSDRVSEEGRENLKKFGIAPPPKFFEDAGMWSVNCPYCDSPYTTMENIFGPTACRSILYCKSCKNPFEAMKPISTLM